jgi:hypothetical protein
LPFARHRHPAHCRAHAFTESEVWLPKKVFATDRSCEGLRMPAP